ncbi:MAG: TM2 domain-containing protein [Bacteroidetes bacterium]|nr:TM2 domain-containing protein [Bacteroidota bacterium]
MEALAPVVQPSRESATARAYTTLDAKKTVRIQKKLEKLQQKQAQKGTVDAGKQILAIILCFFLGGLAIHRVVMGGTPWLILFYFITFGGIFGIVPLIDFFALIFVPEKYEGSNRFFAFLG